MREQRGYVFHQGKSWFVRYCDDVLHRDGSIKRVQVCKKLEVPYCDQYRTKASVKPFVEDILRPVNTGTMNPQSTMSIAEFMEKIHLPKLRERKRSSTMKGYRDIWEIHLKGRMSKINLREFRTVHGEQLLADIARQDMDQRTKQPLSHNSLARIKSFLSGTFKQAKRLGILDGVNPMMDVSTPDGTEAQETYAYSLHEIKKILGMLGEPAYTIVLTAALSGLRKGEIMGLRWEDFTDTQLSVRRSIWKNTVNEPKTKYSKAPIPVVKILRAALNEHRQKMGKLAIRYIFQSGNGNPLNLDNLARRIIIPAIEKCCVCRKSKREHKIEGHMFKLDETLQWHGWHAFRRGLATNLHALGVDDKTIQAILRHSNVGLTMNVYVKSVNESQVSAMDALSEKLETCNDLAMNQTGRLN